MKEAGAVLNLEKKVKYRAAVTRLSPLARFHFSETK